MRRESFHPADSSITTTKAIGRSFAISRIRAVFIWKEIQRLRESMNSDADEEGNCIDYANHAEDELERTIISRSSQFQEKK